MLPNESLRRFRDEACQRSFGAFVAEHANLVWSVALRQCDGKREAAEEIVQTVFTDVARLIHRLDLTRPLSGWLVRHTCLKALEAGRSERRRLQREDKAWRFDQATSDPADSMTASAGYEHAAIADEILATLPSADREALVLRFYENRELRQVGEALGIGEEAARKRVTRALERLRGLLARRGIATSAALLSTGLLAAAAPSGLPAGLVSRITDTALREGLAPVARAAMWGTVWQALTGRAALAALAAVSAAAAVAVPLYQNARHEKELASLRARLDSSPVPASAVAAASGPRSGTPHRSRPLAGPAGTDPLTDALITMMTDSVTASLQESKTEEMVARWTAVCDLTPAQADSLRAFTRAAFERNKSGMRALLEKPEFAKVLRSAATGSRPSPEQIALLQSFTKDFQPASAAPSWAEKELSADQMTKATARLAGLRSDEAESIATQRLAALTALADLSEADRDRIFQFYAAEALSVKGLVLEEFVGILPSGGEKPMPDPSAEEKFLESVLPPQTFTTWKAHRLE